MDATVSQGSRPQAGRVGWARQGVRVDMGGSKAALATVHAKLEAMVLRARRGTHQGGRRISSGDARAAHSKVAECERCDGIYTGAAGAGGVWRGAGSKWVCVCVCVCVGSGGRAPWWAAHKALGRGRARRRGGRARPWRVRGRVVVVCAVE